LGAGSGEVGRLGLDLGVGKRVDEFLQGPTAVGEAVRSDESGPVLFDLGNPVEGVA
jgi:hypothetical protein